MLSGKNIPEFNSNLYHSVSFSSRHINRLILKKSYILVSLFGLKYCVVLTFLKTFVKKRKESLNVFCSQSQNGIFANYHVSHLAFCVFDNFYHAENRIQFHHAGGASV